MIEKFKDFLREMIKIKVPDIHIMTDNCPCVRKHDGDIEYQENFGVLKKEDIKEIITEMLGGEKEFQNFSFSLEQDFSYTLDEAKFRVNIYNDSRGYSIAMRYIPIDIPALETLNITKEVRELLHKGKGLILVTGPTGSGKSTTLASMIQYINNTFKKHIITIEDPIEFNFRSNKCIINQREIGTHSKSFLRAIKSALREDPDVIMVGEMRDPETISAALTLAETGHLVLSTLHTNDTVSSIDRIVDSFPAAAQSQIRTQLAMSLIGVVSQILLPKKDSSTRVVVREVLFNNDAVKSLIIRGNTHQIYSIIELSGQDGMILMDKYLEVLYNKGLISKEIYNSR
ncbi:PilT/PilU family type 4a pilus ATPase, partial [Candidatus Gracilibacteria bacterium]|nr:PilT/PilU family type 4a pilus ATPase [Candidatus Gracilibacteria bacterium]